MGLYFVLARIELLDVETIGNLLPTEICTKDKNSMSISAPFDTDIGNILSGVIEEVDFLKESYRAIGGKKIISDHMGSVATGESWFKLLEEEPSIIYFAGHGKVINKEAKLVFHRSQGDLSKDGDTQYIGQNEFKNVSSELGIKMFFPQRPIIILNACNMGTIMSFGGMRQDLTAYLLKEGACCVIAFPFPVFDHVCQLFAKSLFDENKHGKKRAGDMVLRARRAVAKNDSMAIDSIYWAAWRFIYLHGNPNGYLEF